LSDTRTNSLNTPPSIGPIISGLLLLRWSWRSVFWFLSAATPCCLIPMVLCLPETARSIVGDGTLSTSGFNKPPFSFLVPEESPYSPSSTSPRHKVEQKLWYPNPFASLKLLKSTETAVMLIVYGLGYSIYSCLQASLSTLFTEIYQVSGVAVGLIYIPFGVACASAAMGTGRILDWNYRRTAKELGLTIDKTKTDDLLNFPIERARIRTIKPLVLLSACLIAGYGWLLDKRVSMAGPLVVQFFIGLTIQGLFTSLNTLIVDIHQESPSTAQATCNFVRCELAAGFLAALGPLLSRLGPGWTFVLLAAFIAVLIVPGLAIVEQRGLRWRQHQAVSTANIFNIESQLMEELA
jgi:MFS family permease